MGFKIESISEVSNIASSMTSAVAVIDGFANQVKSSLDELPNIISGQNIDTTLKTFHEKISEFMAKVSSAEKKVNEFIASQARAYAENEEAITAELAKIESVFDDISFE